MADPRPNTSPPASSLTARELWRVSVTAISGRSLPLRNVPVTDGQGRLVAAIQDVVVCLVASPNEVGIAWEYLTGDFIPGSPAVASDGSLRVHSCDRRLHGLSAAGVPLWPAVEVGDPLSWASPLVDQDGNTWLCSATGGLIKVDAQGQKSARPFLRSPTRFDCAGVMHSGRLIVGGEDQFVHAIDLSGNRGAEVWDPTADRGKTNWFINSAIAVAEGPVFVVASRDDHLYGFSTEGEELWKTPTPGRVLGSPIIDGKNRVLVGVSRETSGTATGGALACFDLRRRTWQWEAAARGPVESTPVVGANGTIYFGDNAGYVHAVNDMGRTLASHDIGHPVRSAGVLIGNHQVVFGDDSGSLFALSCDSAALSSGWPKLLGPILWTTTETADAPSHLATEGTRTKIRVTGQGQAPQNSELAEEAATRSHDMNQPERASVRFEPLGTGASALRLIELPESLTTSATEVAAIPLPEAPPQPTQALAPTPASVPAVSEQPPIVTPLIDTIAVPKPDLPDVVPTVTQPEKQPGRLISVIDFLSGTELLAVSPSPWRVARAKELNQFPLLLTNDGPGDLEVTLQTCGNGLSVSPSQRLRIPTGRKQFIVLNITASADEWLLLDFQTSSTAPGRRQRIRIQRH